MSRRAAAALAAVVVATSLTFTASSSAPIASAAQGEHFPNAVEMSVDYAARTITIVGRLDFYQPSGTKPSDDTIAAIVAEIESKWNGHKFKCFDVIIEVDARAVNRKDQVRDDAVDVRLALNRIPTSRTGPGSHVVGSDPNGNVLSDDPAERPTSGRETGPETTPPTTWQKYTPGVWAHEFGHVLGLHDNYVNGGKDLAPGASRDMMFHQRLPVSAETITRVVRRNNTNGQLDESRMKCSLSMTAGPASINVIIASISGLYVKAYACDYDAPSTDPAHKPRPIQWNGEAGVSGSFTSPFGSASGSFSTAISFTSEAEVPYAFSAVSSTGSIDFGGTYRWGTEGLPVNVGALTLYGIDSASVGLPLYPVFTEGAPECP